MAISGTYLPLPCGLSNGWSDQQRTLGICLHDLAPLNLSGQVPVLLSLKFIDIDS